jgi:AbrB family looped-hinge helix DNA binding protein
MKASTLTVKGQVTVPKEIRDALGWKPGDALTFVRDGDVVRQAGAGRAARGRGSVERLRRVPWKKGLTTSRLMSMTRGDE